MPDHNSHRNAQCHISPSAKVTVPIGQCVYNYYRRKYPATFDTLFGLKMIDIFDKCTIRRNYIPYEINCNDCMYVCYTCIFVHKLCK